MKHHNKTYEDVFSIDKENSKVKLNLDEIKFRDMSLGEYTNLFNGFLTSFYSSYFDNCVRLSWLRRNFTYYGMKTKMPMMKNPPLLHLAFVKYLRRIVGKDIQIITKGKIFAKIEMYFDELFPGFCEGNPFENPEYYKFPFKNISMDFLMVVHQLDDRIELLKKADENKMTYSVFVDYVINYVYSENEDLGRSRYQIKLNMDRNSPFCVVDTDKVFQARKGKKRNL